MISSHKTLQSTFKLNFGPFFCSKGDFNCQYRKVFFFVTCSSPFFLFCFLFLLMVVHWIFKFGKKKIPLGHYVFNEEKVAMSIV